MGLPLPRVVADVGPGGPLVTSMRGINALADDMLSNKIKGVQADYAPLTTQAEAASKLAYANLMGPQFLAKLMGNPDVVANSPELQDPRTAAQLYKAGVGGGTGNALMNLPGHPAQSNGSFGNFLTNKVRGLFGGSDTSQLAQQPNALSGFDRSNMSPQDMQGMNALRPGQSYVVQGNGQQGQGPNSGYAYDAQGNNIVASPQEIAAAGGGNQNIQSQTPRTYAENAGTYRGTIAEGEEAGKIRAKDIQDLNDVVFNAETKQATLDDINQMIASPEIKELRQVPLAGRHELAFYAKYGTPAQQQLIGRLYAQMGNIVKDSSRDFAGQFRKGEQQLLQGMKPNDSDTIDSMIGKAESLSVMNQLLAARSKITSQYMNQYHVNKLQASEMADKQINGEAIRSQVHNTLNPKPTDEDINYMAEKYKISPDEVKKRLKAKGVQ